MKKNFKVKLLKRLKVLQSRANESLSWSADNLWGFSESAFPSKLLSLKNSAYETIAQRNWDARSLASFILIWSELKGKIHANAKENLKLSKNVFIIVATNLFMRRKAEADVQLSGKGREWEANV